ncbi:MAG: dipeptidase [Gemmatimonadota bacterium]
MSPASPVTSNREAPVSAHARELHERVLVWDAHMDSLQRVVVDGVDLGNKSNAQADLVQWKEGGVNAQVFAVWVDTIYAPYHAARRALEQIDAFHNLLAKYPDRIELALTGADVRRIAGQGKLAAMLAMEGGVAIQNDLALLRTYARLGATSMTLTHSASIDWVDSSTDKPKSGGLSPFGREVIREMNRLRMIVDVSHVSDDTIRQCLEISTAPIIASHSSAQALSNHPRNVSDELLKAIAAKGGVVGVNFYSEFLDQGYRDIMAKRVGTLEMLNRPTNFPPEDLDRHAAERLHGWFRDGPTPPPFSTILDHIDHMVRIAGVDHVGIGSDLDATKIPTPAGMDSVSDFPKITGGLLDRGYSETDVGKIMGGNFLRVFEAVRGG